MAFSYYKTITVNNGQVSGTQSGFPMLVSFTDTDLKTVGNGGFVQNSNGYDIGFYSDIGLTTKLNWETELYTATTGVVVYWVNVSSITDGTVIYMAFGNTSITTDQSNKTAVWDSSYVAVYHVPDGSTLNSTDSTSNALNAGSASATASVGKIDGGALFDGTTNYFNISTSALFNPTTITASAWVKLNGAPPNYGNIMSKDYNAGWRWRIDTTTSVVHVFDRGGTNNVASSGSIADATWTYVAFTGTASGISIYINGAADTTNAGAAWGHGSSANDFLIGVDKVGNTEFFKGTLDELRVSSTNRTAGWITTEYNNQSTPSSFYTVGTKTSVGGFIGFNIAFV
jgi:hypothetical protein